MIKVRVLTDKEIKRKISMDYAVEMGEVTQYFTRDALIELGNKIINTIEDRKG